MPITKVDLQSIYSLEIVGDQILTTDDTFTFYTESRINSEIIHTFGNIKDLSDLAYMPNLTRLILANQVIADLSPLKGLPIQSLIVPNNNITDLSILQELPMLQTLNISGNPIRSLDLFETLDISGAKSQLKTLYISCLNLPNLDFLQSLDLQELHFLNPINDDISYEPIKTQSNLIFFRGSVLSNEIGPILGSLRKLKSIELFSTDIYDCHDLYSLVNLESLTVYACRNFKSIQGIEHFPKLKYLNISLTDVTDLSPILSLSKLSSLAITNAPIQPNDYLQQLSTIQRLEYSEDQRDWIPENLLQ